MNNNSIESVTTTAGLAGFIVLFSLAIACWVLFRGMSKRLRRIRLREEREAAARQAAIDEAAQQGEPAEERRPEEVSGPDGRRGVDGQ